MNKRIISVLTLFALLAGGSTSYYLNSTAESLNTSQPESGQTEKANPLDIVLLDLDSRPHKMDEWKGKVVVINFWATWCPPCRREIPTIIALQDELGDKGVQFVGVAVDSTKRVRQYVNEHNIDNYPTLQGESAGLDFSIALGNRRSILPYTVIVDRNGEIIDRHTGEATREHLLSQINPLL